MQNESTPGARGPVFCGVDTHADSHWLCVLDWRGRRVLSRRFPADAAGYEALAGAIAAAGEPACVAMEGTSSYGAASPGTSRRLGCPCARRSPRRGCRGGARGRGSATVSVNIIFTISTNAFSPIAPTRIHRIRQRGCAAFGA